MKNNELLQKIEKLEQEMAEMKASRGPRAFFRRALSKSSLILGVIIAAVLTGFLGWAVQNTFTDGTVISADAVNNNFNELYAAKWGVNGSNFYYNGGNVGVGTDTPMATLEVAGDVIRTISYAQGTGNDTTCNSSGSCGPTALSSRVLNFTKKKSSTKIRVQYVDNLRTYSGTGASCCQWEVRFDGASCPSGIIKSSIYNGGSYNQHVTRSVFGYCNGLSAGARTAQVYVQSCASSDAGCYTGWPGDATWTIEVEEVN